MQIYIYRDLRNIDTTHCLPFSLCIYIMSSYLNNNSSLLSNYSPNRNNINNSSSSSHKCKFCPNTQLDTETEITFGERICYHCKSIRSDYQGIIKSKAKKEFLLTDRSFVHLKHIEKLNPKNASFRPMKIYLRKHVKDLAISLYGSMERIEEEKLKRLRNAAKKRKKKQKVRIDDFTTGKRKDRNTIIIEDEDVDKEIVDANNPFKKLKSLRTFASRSISNNNMKKRRNTKKQIDPDHVHKFKPVNGSSSSSSSGSNDANKTLERCECGFEREVEEM